MMKLYNKILFLYFILHFLYFVNCDEIYTQDLGNDMQIGIPEGGYKSVKLKCGSNSMHVSLETEEDFFGVIYTRGSYHDKESSCYLDPGYKRGQRSFSMQFPLNKCKTYQNGSIYSNVLVVQNDKELIMPGDAAFKLECDFRKPREISVQAKLSSSSDISSKITLTSPDHGGEEPKDRRKRTVAESRSDTKIKLNFDVILMTVLTLTPEEVRLKSPKDILKENAQITLGYRPLSKV